MAKQTVTEVCPYCMIEVTIECDVIKDGYKASCSYCGEMMLLCDACLHAADNSSVDEETGYIVCGRCDWDKVDNSCFRIRKKEVDNG